MNDDTDTNFGWWADKPERSERRAHPHPSRWSPAESPRSPNVWPKVGLIVALMLTLGWSLMGLAGR